MVEENNLEQKNMLLFDDRAKVDLLDYESYSDTLSTLIKNFPSENSLTVGVFGDWGSGKTTLLSMINDNLNKDDYKSIWVDSWYIGNNDEEIWKTFLQSILLYVKRELTFFEKIGFHISLIKKNKLWEKFPNVLFKIIIIVSIFYFVFSSVNWGEAELLKDLLSNISVVIGIVWALKPIINEFNEKINVDIQGMSHTSTLLQKASANDEFKNSFESMVKILAKKKGKVVFIIDDLDRCYPDQIPQILDTFKRFLNFPNCVYVLGMDRRIVEEAMISRFPNFSNPRIEARKYLEKLITLPFDLPPLSSDQMDSLVAGLKINLPEYSLCKQIFTLGQEANPRKVKRTINVFLLLWTLVNNRQKLKEVIEPIRLAKIVVIQHNYRDLSSLINIDPTYIGELEKYFRLMEIFQGSPQKIDQYTDELPDILKEFITDTKLNQLLCMHEIEDEKYNFIKYGDDSLHVIERSIIQPYVQLTNTISASSMEFSHHLFQELSPEFFSLRQLLDSKSKYKVFVLTGVKNSGKSSLVKQLINIYRGNQLSFIYINIDNISTISDVVKNFNRELPRLDLIYNDDEYVIQKIFANSVAYSDVRTIIFFDHFENANDVIKNWIHKLLRKFIASQSDSTNLIISIITNNIELINEEVINNNSVKTIRMSEYQDNNFGFTNRYLNVKNTLNDYMNNPYDDEEKG